MELVRLSTSLARLGDVAAYCAGRHVVVECADADTVMGIASLGPELAGPIGAWLELSDDYVAQMAGRDVATLSWLVELDHVVVSSPTLAARRAEVVRALLSDDEVNLVNEVATLTGAYNRPAPPRPVRVWSFDGEELVSLDGTLRAGRTTLSELGEVTVFS